MPKDIIERNLKRAEDKDTADLAEHFIEVYGPGGTGYIMDCLTDNKQRATTEIWTAIKKLNAKVRPAHWRELADQKSISTRTQSVYGAVLL